MDTMETLHEGAPGKIELLQCSGLVAHKSAPGSVPSDFHIVIPCQGAFVWHAPDEEIFADVTRVLFAGGGERYQTSHPVGGDKSLVLTPSPLMLAEILGPSQAVHSLLTMRWRKNDYAAQLLQRALYVGGVRAASPLALDELFLALLTTLLTDHAPTPPRAGRRAALTLARTKAFLHNTHSDTSLSDVAAAVGVSPTYLTRLFRTSEGVPLHQYVLKLKMAKALEALDNASDLTRLALDLGFSSHSHLTSSFRSRFGASPTTVRSNWPAAAPDRSCKRLARPLCAARGGMAS